MPDYITLSSEITQDRANKPSLFSTPIIIPYINTQDNLHCALTEIKLTSANTDKELFICCDIIKSSQVKSTLLPLLRSVSQSVYFINWRYYKINKPFINDIKISIYQYTDGKFIEAELTGITSCVLAITKQ